jgi:hypothetical protein
METTLEMNAVNRSREAAFGVTEALEEIRRRNGYAVAKQTGDARFGAECKHEGVYKSRCVKCLRIVLAFVLLALTLGSARADGYDTYAGNSGLVTIAQKEQAQGERESAAAFRGMSIADRWDNDSGSIARRWPDNGPGSVAARWSAGNYGSIEQRWENK